MRSEMHLMNHVSHHSILHVKSQYWGGEPIDRVTKMLLYAPHLDSHEVIKKLSDS